METDTLYIIGNGFDLHHGLKTSYYDFRDVEVNKNSFLKRNLLDIYGEQINEDMWWSDFEKMLAHIDYNNLASVNNGVVLGMPKVKSFLENNLGVFFGGWIKNTDGKINKQSIQNKIDTIDHNARFFSFNYTMLLEKVYDIVPDNVWHIHKSIRDIANGENVIVGHDANTRELFNIRLKYRETQGLVSTAFIDEIEQAAANGAKKVVQRIAKHEDEFHEKYSGIKHFVAMGFSFNDIDMPYIKKIVKVNKDINETDWTIYFHKEEEVDIIKNKLLQTISLKEEQLH